MANLVYPKLTGWVGVPPHPRFLNANEPWAADDPFVTDNPEFFSPDPQIKPRRSAPVTRDESQVEQATAAPGEKRTTRKPAKTSDAE